MPEYALYRDLLREEALPAALVDLDAFDRNLERLLAPVRAKKKVMRIASKSIRCVELIRRAVERSQGTIQGVMAYAAREAAMLAERGFADVLIAYPTVCPPDLAAIAGANQRGASVAAVADAREHVEALERAAVAAEATVPVVVDVDVSYRPMGQVHIGVRRSPIRSPEEVVALAQDIAGRRNLRFAGVLAYEAQIAGVPDDSLPVRLMKARSVPDVRRIRADIRRALEKAGIAVPLFNGGGTGSVASACEEEALTEVTVGSGLAASHLFDRYRSLALEPALMFALQVVRAPAADIRTCHGGGYVASGQAGADRLPKPYLPEGLELLPLEGAGEVQTPLRIGLAVDLPIGAPVLFRHAKAGELAEHFNEYLFVSGGRIAGRAKTYRGEGHSFL